MKLFSTTTTRNAVRSLLGLSLAALLFACGGNNENAVSTSTSSNTQEASKPLSLSVTLSPSPADTCSEVATVAVGDYHTVGLMGDGTVVAVGYNGFGELNVSSWTEIKAIAAGAYHTAGLKEDGTVVAVGRNGNGQLNVSDWTHIKAIAAGAYHTIGLKEDGTVLAVGHNGYGQLNVSSWTNIKNIAAGRLHTVGLKEDGTVVAIGYNGNGQLNVSSWVDIKAIAAGAYHTAGLKDDGTVLAVGNNGYGQLNVSSWVDIKAIAAGAYHTAGLKDDGAVLAVGYNGYGQSNVSSWTDIKAIAAGAYHTAGLHDDGTVTAVGSNIYGQLNVSSWVSIMPICDALCDTTQDIIPPITTVLMSGTLGNDGWYVSDVQMALTARDDEGGSGVKEIHYFIDGMEAVVEGNSAAQLIAGDGTHVVSWYSVDNAGNVEMPPQQMIINIDTTAPAITGLGADIAILWPPNHKMVNVVIGGSLTADSGSEIVSKVITVTDEYGIYSRTVSDFGSVVPLEAWRDGSDMDGRVYTITAVITDRAGNQSTASTTVLVPHNR